MPAAFAREMSVLESIAGSDPRTAIAPMSAAAARPYFDRVIAVMMRRQPVRTELQNRDHLDAAEVRPYCELVIAFYQAVLELPHDDKVDLLRHLYAAAAVNADADLSPWRECNAPGQSSVPSRRVSRGDGSPQVDFVTSRPMG
jgi:hypothetical protein